MKNFSLSTSPAGIVLDVHLPDTLDFS